MHKVSKTVSSTPERQVAVCSYCLRASCWQGKFSCKHSKVAGVTELPVKTLKKLKLEHPDFWKIKR
jgi:hypothetical protein